MEGGLEISLRAPGVKGRSKRRRSKRLSKPGCKIFVGRLPEGFGEVQLRDYFKQFGNVLGVYIPRSEKTGRMKGCGFVEFPDPAVAQIAAEAMNNYLMFDKLLKCTVIEESSTSLAGKRWAPATPSRDILRHIRAHNRDNRHPATLQKAQNKLRDRLGRKNKALEKLGLDYKFPVPSEADLKGSLVDVTAASQYSMLLDSDEDEISFKAPPQSTKKSLKKTSVTPAASPLGLPKKAKKTKKPAQKRVKTE